MKLVIILFGFLVAQTTWALDRAPNQFERKTWAEIEADNSLYVNWPMTMGVPINKVCLTKNKVKSLVPVRTCKEWQISTARDCSKKTDWCYTTNDNLYNEGQSFDSTYHKCMNISVNNKAQISRLMTTSKCIETFSSPMDESSTESLKCKKYKAESYTFPQKHNVKITDYRQHNGESFNWGYKEYAIPLCN